MAVNILFFILAAVISVKGQFLNAEYRLDSVPLPIRRRMDNARYEIQPSLGREIVLDELSTETARVSNQGRRHIDSSRRGNIQSGQINTYESEPYQNIYPSRNYDTRPVTKQINNNERLEEYNLNQFNPQTENQNIERNRDGVTQRNKDGNRLRTNLDNKQSSSHRGYSQTQESSLTNYNVGKIENIYQRPVKTDTNNRNTNISQNEDYKSHDNVINSENVQTYDISRNNFNNDNNQNNNRRTEGSQRAIDSNPHRNQQSIGSSNVNRNYDNKPSRQNTDITKGKDNRQNTQTTEVSRKYTIYDNTVTSGTKYTEDNELVSNIDTEGRSDGNDDDRWIWMTSSNSTNSDQNRNSTVEPTLPAVDDRAAFSGDKCPSGQVRYNNICIPTD